MKYADRGDLVDEGNLSSGLAWGADGLILDGLFLEVPERLGFASGWRQSPNNFGSHIMSTIRPTNPRNRKRKKLTQRAKKKDPLYVDGKRPRPTYVDYKDVELLKKLVNRHGRIVGRRKTGCSAISQHVVSKAIKRARFMGLLPYTGE